MRIIHQPAEWMRSGGRKVCAAIGFFDGVHLGHQQIIRQTVSDARQHEGAALVITFNRHPNSIVAPDRVPPLIYSLPQRLREIASLGVDMLLLIDFDEPFSRQSGETFIRKLATDFAPIHSVCVGADFMFGHKRSGNVALLQSLGRELRFVVHGLAALSLDSQPVSSTRIREAIQSGDFERAGEMLGRAYSLCGLVEKGQRVGHELGFPTANLAVAGLALPPNGVYVAHASFGGKTLRSVVNIGVRPTLAETNPQRRVEAHLLDFQGDLYGAEMEITFAQKLRDEMRFASLAELRQQISRDVNAAQNSF